MFSEELYAPILHIPDGVNFDCTGCGNCCFTWPVPATDDDVKRIAALTPDDKPRFAQLKSASEKLRTFTHFLDKDKDGNCQYFEGFRCRLHSEHGIEAKPAMCRLFPYTFTLTPSGAYTSLSFASTGVLLNSGRPLTDQRAVLQEQLRLYETLFPGEPDWSSIQTIDGTPLRWADYMLLERQLLSSLNLSQADRAMPHSLLGCSTRIIACGALDKVDLEHNGMMKSQPAFMDRALISLLMEMYFPTQAFEDNRCDFDAEKLVQLLKNQSQAPKLEFEKRSFDLSDLAPIERRANSEEVNELLSRFLYMRVFAKLYFGPGFNGLSVLSGFHHLLLLCCLCRLRLKMRIACQVPEAELLDALREDIRMMERRLTVTTLTRQSQAAMEVMLQGPERIKRILACAY